MKNKARLMVLLFLVTVASASCQKHCDLKGDWLVTGTRSPHGETYLHDRVSFSTDSIWLASGFYYPIIDQNNFEDWQSGRYPFVYYGNREKYKIAGDSLYLFSNPYGTWNAYKILCNEFEKVHLVGDKENWVLVRRKDDMPTRASDIIQYIKAHVYEPADVGNYAINYRVTYTNDEKLFYQQLSEKDQDRTVKTIQLNRGAFAEICKGFDYVDVKQISKAYSANFSDPEIIELEIGLEDGVIIKSRIEVPAYPEDLKLALIPILYGYQRWVYPNLKPID